MSGDGELRTPAVQAKLDEALATLSDLRAEIAAHALAAAENKPGAAGKLASLREKIVLASSRADELQAALLLAQRFDRQSAAAAVSIMRASQFVSFKARMSERSKAMTAVLEAAAALAKAYGDYSEATLAAQIAVPSGTGIPAMTIGPNGMFGPAFGRCERLILGELFRLGPMRADGAGRLVLPFAEAPNANVQHKPEAIPPAGDEMRAADAAIIADIETQIARLDDDEMAAIEEKAA